MNYSILLLCRYTRKGPSSRVRHYNYLPVLERAGFLVTAAPFLDDEYLERLFGGERHSPQLLIKAYWRRLRQVAAARRYDLIWVEKEALPWLPASWELASLGGRPVVIDFDDRMASALCHPGIRWSASCWGISSKPVVAQATDVTAGSSMLASWAKTSGASSVIELPVTVDIDRYPILPLPDGPFTIGWIGTPMNDSLPRAYCRAAASSSRGLWSAAAVDRRQRPAFRCGRGHRSCSVARGHGGRGTCALPRWHHAVADGPWERGKCGYKLIQYMAAARPAVASALGASTSIISPERPGFSPTIPRNGLPRSRPCR